MLDRWALVLGRAAGAGMMISKSAKFLPDSPCQKQQPITNCCHTHNIHTLLHIMAVMDRTEQTKLHNTAIKIRLHFSVAIATIRTRFFHVDILKSMWIYYYLVLVYPHSF